MKRSPSYITAIPAAIAFLVMILDSKCALESAKEGVLLCVQNVIPSLFLFVVLSVYISSHIPQSDGSIVQRFGSRFGLPPGAEGLLILGVLGGYPVGAQCVDQAYVNGKLSRKDAQRMLGFCSNAGPAFILGCGCALFDKTLSFALWAIHVLSALIVAFVSAKSQNATAAEIQGAPISFDSALQKGIRIIATVCAWVICFRVLIGFLERWFFWALPASVQVLLKGALELVNGFVALGSVSQTGAKFVIASVLLGFGGLCVTMQTFSVTKHTGMGRYIPGKLLQTAISFLLAVLFQMFFLPTDERYQPGLIPWVIALTTLILATWFIRRKKW